MGERFDEIAVALGGHRRTVLGALLAGAGAALVGRDPAGAGPSTCKPPGQACRKPPTAARPGARRSKASPPAAARRAGRAAVLRGRLLRGGEGCFGDACGACLALQANCTDAAQCCQDDGALACGPIGNLGQGQCCRPFGGACSTPGEFDECCAVVPTPGSGSLVYCAPNNTCGGPGARCTVAATCASGVCCNNGIDGVCCAAGQQCVGSQCVG